MAEHEKAPKRADEQESPQPERLVTPQEEEGTELQELEHPPQAEGPRERDEGETGGGGRGAGRPGEGRKRTGG